MFSINASAQKDHLAEANKTYEAGQYFEAITLMKKAYSKEKDKANKADIIYKTAECYRMVNDMKQAETWYRKAIKIKYPENKIQLYYANALKANGKFEDAIVEYEKYAELAPDDPRGKNGAEACALAQKWIDNPSRYVVENEVQLNGKQMDFSPNYASANHKEVYFTSSRNNASGGDVDGWTGQGFTDIFSATIDNKGKWSKPKPLPATISSIYNEGAAVMNADFTEMIFTRCGVKKKVKMGCELYHTKKEGSSWSEPELLPFFLDSVNSDSVSVTLGHPALSADGKKLLGAVLVGDTEAYGTLLQLMLNDMDIPGNPASLILPAMGDEEPVGLGVSALPDTAQICSCFDVSKGDIAAAVQGGCCTMGDLKDATKASTGCGGCTALVKQVMDAELESMGVEVNNDLCEHFAYTRAELADIVRIKGYTSFKDVVEGHGKGHGCEICKPTIGSILASFENEYVLKGITEIEEFNEYFSSKLDVEEYETIGGILLHSFGHVPAKDEGIEIDNFKFEIIAADTRKIKLVRVAKIDFANQASRSKRS